MGGHVPPFFCCLRYASVRHFLRTRSSGRSRFNDPDALLGTGERFWQEKEKKSAVHR